MKQKRSIMKKIGSIVLISSLLMGTLLACSPKEDTSHGTESSDGYVAITNPAGEEISIPENIESIVSMAPTFTEVVVALGYGDKLVAVDTYSDYIEGLPADVKYFDLMAPDVEQLIALQPDLILVSTMSTKDGNDYYAQLEKEGITVVYIPSSDSIEGIYEDLMFMGQIFNEEAKGQTLVKEMKEEFRLVEEKAQTITDKKTVYFEIAAAPNLYTFGSGVFLDEIIRLVGAENIIDDKDGWTSISEEVIILKNPDVIITNVNYIENPTEEIKARDGWENVTAVKNNAVYYVDNMSSSHSNHTIIKALHEIAEAIYPDIY